MIVQHQPTIFRGAIKAALSSRTDGDMKRGRLSDDEVFRYREDFLRQCDISMDQAVLVSVGYDKAGFTEYHEVGVAERGQGMHGDVVVTADALVTRERGVALFLPLADCVGTILYDPVKKVLMVSHLGRHSIEQNGGYESVMHLKQQYGVNPANLLVWLSPSPGPEKYPLYSFDNRGMHEVVIEQLLAAGVTKEHSEVSLVDTAKSNDYFSHSEFLKGNRTDDGRFAIVAMIPMTAQGEPAF